MNLSESHCPGVILSVSPREFKCPSVNLSMNSEPQEVLNVNFKLLVFVRLGSQVRY